MSTALIIQQRGKGHDPRLKPIKKHQLKIIKIEESWNKNWRKQRQERTKREIQWRKQAKQEIIHSSTKSIESAQKPESEKLSIGYSLLAQASLHLSSSSSSYKNKINLSSYRKKSIIITKVYETEKKKKKRYGQHWPFWVNFHFSTLLEH